MPVASHDQTRLPGWIHGRTRRFVVVGFLWLLGMVEAFGGSNFQPVVETSAAGTRVHYALHGQQLMSSPTNAPSGVQLMFPGGDWNPVIFGRWQQGEEGWSTEMEDVEHGLRLRWSFEEKSGDVIQRTLTVTALRSNRFTARFPVEVRRSEAEYASFSGSVKSKTSFDTVRGAAHVETFPVALARRNGRVVGIAADSPGLWENRCQVQIDPALQELAVLTGDGRAPYPLVLRPPEDARDTYQYSMDGWQQLAAGETRRYVTWVFVGEAGSHYDAQMNAHLAVANGKGWNGSAVEAILRNTSLFLLRRNLALDAEGKPRDGKYIFISGPGYGWKQWVSDGFYTALGLDDPEKTIESNRAVFWTRMDYEDNAHYYLIWSVLMKRAGGSINEALVRRAYEFIKSHEVNGCYLPPSLPGAPNAKGWKTYHDVLPYETGDCPASDQGFHCGALLAARELGLPVREGDVDRAVAGYRAIFNRARGFMPTSRMQPDILGQDTLYGATLTYAVFGVKLLEDEQVLTHHRTSEKVKTPYGLRVISQADGSLLPGHSGVYCYGGSWFLNDAANYLLAGVHGLPEAEVDRLLAERILRELAQVPAFNESISTLDGHPHGHVLYSWNSGYWWVRKELRKRLGQTGPDRVDEAVDRALGVVRDGGGIRLHPVRSSSSPKSN